MRLTVACVLRTGSEFTREHVAALRDCVGKNLSLPYRFVCLTDDEGPRFPCDRIALAHRWPRWWSKMELFSSEFQQVTAGDPVLYLDLDTILVKPIDDIAVGQNFVVLRNFWAKDRIGSGLMAWSSRASSSLLELYEKFRRRSLLYMQEYTTTEKWGDQGFIRFNSPIQPDLWQDLYPGRVVSYRAECVPKGRIPQGASVVCFGGKSRPWTLPPEHRGWFDHVD